MARIEKLYTGLTGGSLQRVQLAANGHDNRVDGETTGLEQSRRYKVVMSIKEAGWGSCSDAAALVTIAISPSMCLVSMPSEYDRNQTKKLY